MVADHHVKHTAMTSQNKTMDIKVTIDPDKPIYLDGREVICSIVNGMPKTNICQKGE